jgi:hypothetical protein
MTQGVIGPSARCLPSLVYDPINERTMLFGGSIDDRELGDTWVFDWATAEWSEMTFENSPSARHSAGIVYDSTHEVIILYGGYNGTSPSSDLWVFDCVTEEWAETPPEDSPSVRMSHAMVYDVDSEKVIVFSGYGPEGAEDDDTWAYDYPTNSWQEMTPLDSPHARYGAGCYYDDSSGSMVIFGGNSHGYFSDTWSYDCQADQWTELSPSIHPGALKWASMTYLSGQDRGILFGGDSTLSQVENRTWVYDVSANAWREMNPTSAPPSRQAAGLAYDRDSRRAILFGGADDSRNCFDDTWAYDFESDTWQKTGEGHQEEALATDPIIILTAAATGAVMISIVYVLLKRQK